MDARGTSQSPVSENTPRVANRRLPQPARVFADAGLLLAEALLIKNVSPAAIAVLVSSMASAIEAPNWSADNPEERIRIAGAAAVLSIARPDLATRCDDLIAKWTGPGIGAPRHMVDPRILARRVLLAMAINDLEDASQSVEALGNLDSKGGMAGGLYDWVVARIQRHGVAREIQCFDHLKLALSDAWDNDAGDAMTLLLGALLLATHGGLSRDHALKLLDAVPTEALQIEFTPVPRPRPALGTLAPPVRRAASSMRA